MKLDQLPQVAEETLGGLKADASLYMKIRQRAQAPARKPAFPLRRAVALACSLVLVITLGVIGIGGLPGDEKALPKIMTQAAGTLPEGAVLRAWDLPRGSISLGQPGSVPEYQGVWARASGGNFPLIRVNGAFYRLLSNPTSIDSSMLGASLGSVEVFTDEPALDSTAQTLSNVIPAGTQVSQISGMQGTAVAAQMDGKTRVFQRISFSGSALLGGEGLSSTLQGSVVGLQLSGVGTVTDPGQVSSLMNKLFNESSYQSGSTRSTDQALLIQYSNGIVLQMSVKDNSLIACGTWSNPGFIEAFAQAAQ